SSPQTKLSRAVSGRPKEYTYTKSGVIKSNEGVGVTNVLTSSQRVRALGHKAKWTGQNWRSGLAKYEGHGKPDLRRTASEPEKAPPARMAAGRQTKPSEVKTPGFKLGPGGLGEYKTPYSLFRTRILDLIKIDRDHS
ncbi:MAG: hypothetical protein R3257_02410, partial [bacterium]|nr:hypothetical protein [bacterium]